MIKGLLRDKDINLALACGDSTQVENIKKIFNTSYKGFSVPPIITFDRVEENLSLFDAYYSPLYAIPEYIAKCESIVPYIFFYDLDPLVHSENFPDSKDPNFWFTRLVDSLTSRCITFTCSDYTRYDFLKYLPHMLPERTFTTLLAADKSFHPCSSEQTIASLEKYGLPTNKKYIFSLCNLQPRKNLIRVIRTFLAFIQKHKIDDMVFILGGAKWSTFEQEFADEMKKPECAGKILHAGYIDDEDLAPLYSGAHWFVYTSSFEGFGLPPLEAMQCGCPVITSNNTSLPEVVGDAGIMIDWDSDEQHIAAYEEYYFDEDKRINMKKKGIARSKTFSWEKCVQIMTDEMKKNKKLD